MSARRNPYRAYKLAHGLTYSELAARLGISTDHAKKLGTGARVSVTARRAKSFARRTRGELGFLELMDWAAHGRRPTPRRRKRRGGPVWAARRVRSS